ncbi:MAG: hypothetical protein ACFBSG_04305 [Leptolyngbyaceae cyanobacterium]
MSLWALKGSGVVIGAFALAVCMWSGNPLFVADYIPQGGVPPSGGTGTTALAG